MDDTTVTAEIHPKTVRGVTRIARNAKKASTAIAASGTTVKDRVLSTIADNLEAEVERIVEANAEDIANARAKDIGAALIDRLTLTEERVRQIADSVRYIVDLADPIGDVVLGKILPNGIHLQQERVPMGVIGAIYEARPNVTIDIAALGIKSGNAVILRGGSAAKSSNAVLIELVRDALAAHDLPRDVVSGIDAYGRDGTKVLMGARDYVDLLIPRGGADLISTVVHESIVPVIETGVGNVHMYVDASAPLRMATDLVVNSKTHRPSVCNSLETLLVHEKAAKRVLPRILAELDKREVIIHAANDVAEYVPEGMKVRRVSRRDWAKEYLDLELAVKIVADLDEAIEHIRAYSSGHTEVIVTNEIDHADAFVASIDAAAVGVNVSTRFTDGGEFGLGAEVGISTQKLHARGPMGLGQLTTTKWIMRGSGQIRP